MNRSAPFSLAVSTAAIFLALSLSACSRKNETPAGVPASAVPASAVPASAVSAVTPAAEASPQAKLNLYIDCYNQTNGSFRKSLNRYKSWVKNMNVGPTGHELNVYGLYAASGAQDCQKAVESAKAMPPSMPGLEQAASDYAASLGPLEATIGEAYTYYDRENYKDDGFAKGKALHKTLVEQARIFTAASGRFSDALDNANDALQQAQLQRLEKEGGHGLDYYRLSTMIQAKALMRLLMQDNVDVAKVGARLDTFEKSLDDMDKASGDMDKAPGDKSMQWRSYASSADGFRKAAKELYRRLRDKTPYSDGDKSLLGGTGGWMVNGSPDKLLGAYNGMVDASNSLNN